MSEAKAKLNNYRQSPRKVRLVADTVRGKKIEDALTSLSFVPRRSALPIQKLLASALANAKNLSLAPESLVVKEIRVDGGATLFRSRPRSRGMANTIRKRTSHILVTLAEDSKILNKKKSKKVNSKKASAVEDKKS